MMGTWATGPPPGLHTQKRVNRLPRRHRGTVRCDCGAGVAVAVDSGGGDDGVGTATTQMLQSSCFQCRPGQKYRKTRGFSFGRQERATLMAFNHFNDC